MGANNSTKSLDKHKNKRHKDATPRQDVVRGQKITIGLADDRISNRLSASVDGDMAGGRMTRQYRSEESVGPQARSVHTDIPRHAYTQPCYGSSPPTVCPPPDYPGHSAEERLRDRLSSQQTVSSEEDFTEAPVIIRSLPEEGPANMNTIKQAKVNVRDKISFFKETNTPVIQPARNQKPRASGHRHQPSSPDSGEPVHYSAIHTESDVRRASDISDLHRGAKKAANAKKSKHLDTRPSHQHSEIRRTSEPAIISDHRMSSAQSPRVDNSPVQSVERAVTEEPRKEGPAPTYQRMNTLEFLNQVPRQHSILRGFEKAKPARVKKAKQLNSPIPRRGGLPRNGDVRPKSMFTPSSFNSDPNIAADINQPEHWVENSFYQESLGPTNNRTGQKYSIDDADYETLTRKKKIAGQRLAVGFVDQQTEINFLKSLKRNVHFKQAKEMDKSDGGRISDVVF